MVIPNICGSSVWNLLHITLLVPRILRWLLHILRICGPLYYTTHLLCNAAMLSNTSKTSENKTIYTFVVQLIMLPLMVYSELHNWMMVYNEMKRM